MIMIEQNKRIEQIQNNRIDIEQKNVQRKNKDRKENKR